MIASPSAVSAPVTSVPLRGFLSRCPELLLLVRDGFGDGGDAAVADAFLPGRAHAGILAVPLAELGAALHDVEHLVEQSLLAVGDDRIDVVRDPATSGSVASPGGRGDRGSGAGRGGAAGGRKSRAHRGGGEGDDGHGAYLLERACLLWARHVYLRTVLSLSVIPFDVDIF